MTIARSTFRTLLSLTIVSSLLFTVSSCLVKIQDHSFPNPQTLAVTGDPVASNLMSPIGVTEDPRGFLWITEAGSGTASPASGQVSVITPSGAIYPAITGFLSAQSPEGGPEGLNHLIYKDGKLYILHGVDDKLYIVDVSNFVPGTTAPIAASTLTGQDIRQFIFAQNPPLNTPQDSNPYNLTFGPEGDLYIVDAGANAVIRRNKDTGALSVYATFPDITGSPKPFSGDVVPTGIVFDGTKFWVTSLTGAPFHQGLASVFHVTPNGATGTVTTYKTGFTGLTDIALTPGGKPIVTEFGFAAGPPINGRIASGDDAGTTLVMVGPNNPVDILPSRTADTYYVVYNADKVGKIVKVMATK
ncbi:hypothetical protein GCM10027299_05780 [Larkinella ripae]